MKLAQLFEAKAPQTLADKLEKLVAKHYGGYGEDLEFDLAPKIRAALSHPGRVLKDAEFGFGSKLGEKNTSYFDHDKKDSWVEDAAKKGTWLVPMRDTGGLNQGLIKSDAGLYLVTTDGESGTWWIYKLSM